MIITARHRRAYHELHDYGFNQENAADVRYKNFRNDIFNFRHLLEKLDQALQNAQQRYERSPHPTRINAYSPLSADFEEERKTIVGNFEDTLKACDKLLDENRKYRLKYSNVVENLKWHLSQQERRVDDLRTRLQFHSEKIRLVMDRLSINLLTDIDAKVDDILAMSEQNLQVSTEILHELVGFRSALFGHLSGHAVSLSRETETSHRVSDMISLKFQEYLLIDAPPSISRGMPLEQGFDALFSSFQQSISSADCTPESYLSFLKTRWLFKCLSASEAYRAARPGFYYKRAINQISQALKVRMQQPGVLISYEESMLIELPDTHFRVWPPSEPAPTTLQSDPHPLMIRANEEEVMRMTLDTDELRCSDTVTIFKSSEEHFRIIQETTLASRPDERILIPQPIYTREDKLIPRYALPMIDEPEFEVAIFSRNEETLYRFGTSEMLFRFQSALTGYEVSHDQQAIRCQFSDDVGYLDCRGRVQLWQEPIVLGNPSEARRASNAPSSFSDGKTKSRFDSLAATAVTSNTIRWTDGGWEAESIKLPVIVIFTELTDTKDRKQFAILFMELESGVFVNPKECSCCRAYDTCSKLVLTNGKNGITVRALFSDVEQTGHSGFDLFPFRTPRHPDFRKLKTLRTEYLVLKFGRLEDKRRFDKELDYRFRVRDKQTQNQHDFTKRMQKLETQRPLRQPDTVPTRSHGRAFSEASSAFSIPPKLELSESGPRLDSSFVDDIHLDKGFEASSSGAVSPRRCSRRDSPMSSAGVSTVQTCETVLVAPQSSPSPQAPRNNPQYNLSAPLQATAGAAIRPQQREDRLPRPSVASVDTVRQGVQPDFPTARKKAGKRQGLWRNFKF
ncbi:hypothetical protein Q7P35_002655 [Cladosporium inversicolor]